MATGLNPSPCVGRGRGGRRRALHFLRLLRLVLLLLLLLVVQHAVVSPLHLPLAVQLLDLGLVPARGLLPSFPLRVPLRRHHPLSCGRIRVLADGGWARLGLLAPGVRAHLRRRPATLRGCASGSRTGRGSGLRGRGCGAAAFLLLLAGRGAGADQRGFDGVRLRVPAAVDHGRLPREAQALRQWRGLRRHGLVGQLGLLGARRDLGVCLHLGVLIGVLLSFPPVVLLLLQVLLLLFLSALRGWQTLQQEVGSGLLAGSFWQTCPRQNKTY